MKKSSHASTSRSEENEITIQEIFTCRPKKNLTSEFVLLKYVSCKQDNWPYWYCEPYDCLSKVSIQEFTDASENLYAAAIFLREESETEVKFS